MTMLIKGGILHTMTDQGDLTGDVLMQDGRIIAVAPQIDLPRAANPCTLSAAGLHVLPGLIDAHIRPGLADDEQLLRSARAAGITSGLIWPTEEGPCRLMTGDGLREANIRLVHPEGYTDAQLAEQLASMQAQGLLPACEVTGSVLCKRLLAIAAALTGPVLLVHLCGCEGMEDAIAAAKCPVILGVARGPGGSPWAMAARLQALGAAVAITCNHPEAALKHLPVCAALCLRDGMDRARVLQTITSVPADLLGITDVGRIQPGSRADLVLYDGDPLLLATNHVITIQGGKICC